MSSILLSIIIPTKDRYSTLLPLLDYLQSIKADNMEILIQDNSVDNSIILKYLEKAKTKISYFYTDKDISQTENSDLSVLNSQGEYVCFIGDDDGVMPYIVELTSWMKYEKIDAIKAIKPSYSWPGQQSRYFNKNTSGILNFRKFKYRIKTLDPINSLSHNLSKGGTNIDWMPCLYHGIVSKKVLNNIYDETSSYFPGPSPDMANATSLCFYVENFKYLDFPVVISGKSKSSIGGKGIMHDHVAKIENVSHLPKNTIKNWDHKIPKYWTGPTIWAQSTISALLALGKPEIANQLNYSYLYAKLTVFNFSIRKKIFNDFNHQVQGWPFYYTCILQFSSRLFLFLISKYGFNKRPTYYNIKDIGEAIKVVSNNVDLDRLPFNDAS